MDEPEIPIEERAARLQRQNDVQAGRIDTLMTKVMNEHRRAGAAESRATELEEALRDLRREHYECEDCWYSCPKSSEGSCNDAKGDECDCGADAFNARIDALLSLPVPPKGR